MCGTIRLIGTAAAVGTTLLLSQAASVAAVPRRPAVLFAGVNPSEVRTWDDWLASGYEIDTRPIGAIKSVDDFKLFNAVVISDLPPVHGEGRVEKVQPPFEQALAPFLQQGGGVIAFCIGSGFSNTNRSLNHLLSCPGMIVFDTSWL